MTTEPFRFFSLLKIHLATQLVRLSPNLRRGRRVDDGNGTWSPPAISPTNKTQWQSTSCSSSHSSDFNTSHSPCFSPTPYTHFSLQTGAKKYSISTERPFFRLACFSGGICVLWLPSHCQRLIGNLIGRLSRCCSSLSPLLTHISPSL